MDADLLEPWGRPPRDRLYIVEEADRGPPGYWGRHAEKVNGDTTPQALQGTLTLRCGTFIPLTVRNPAQAAQPGFDAYGYADSATLRLEAQALGAFRFSKPVGLARNPTDGTQALFSSSGGTLFPADAFGDVHLVGVGSAAVQPITAVLVLGLDPDALPVPDQSVRSPGAILWPLGSFAYIAEERATTPPSAFGANDGGEASIWKVHPSTQSTSRALIVNRSTVLPVGSTDSAPSDLGAWAATGMTDVSGLLNTGLGELLILSSVRAPTITDGPIGGAVNLGDGGQLVLLRSEAFGASLKCAPVLAGGSALQLRLRNGRPNRPYWFVLAIQNAGNAPNGWFYGVDISITELTQQTTAPFFGLLDSAGRLALDFPIPVPCPLGIIVDTVGIELSTSYLPVAASRAVTVHL